MSLPVDIYAMSDEALQRFVTKMEDVVLSREKSLLEAFDVRAAARAEMAERKLATDKSPRTLLDIVFGVARKWLNEDRTLRVRRQTITSFLLAERLAQVHRRIRADATDRVGT